MHLELVELLRCPVAHAPTVLVAAAGTISNRYVTEGVLGCPECYAEYAIRGGVTHFAVGDPARDILEPPSDATNGEVTTDDSAGAMRLAAQLGLIGGRSVFALIGYDITAIVAMREIVPARVLVLNPSQLDASAFPTEQLQDAMLVAPIGVALCDDVLPLVQAKFDGVAVSSPHASSQLLTQAASALRTGGRLVANVNATLPVGMRELVRDDRVWVAVRESVASAPISILRR